MNARTLAGIGAVVLGLLPGTESTAHAPGTLPPALVTSICTTA